LRALLPIVRALVVIRPSATISTFARERDLIEAAIAVNEAPSLDEAFAVLAETGLTLLGADWLAVIVWNDDLAHGVIRAGSGAARAFVGATIPADPQTVQAIETGSTYSGPPELAGLAKEVADTLGDVATVVRVPLNTEIGRATFHASWRAQLGADELEEATALLHTLSRLTTLAERTLRELDRVRLETVLQGVGEGVVLSYGNSAVANKAAREMLAVPDGSEFRSAMFKPRTLEGEPFPVDPASPPGQSALELDPAGGRFRIRAAALDGRELVLDGSVAPVPGGAAVIFRDVTEEHRREYLNEQYGKALFDSMPTAITVIDPATHETLAANRAFLELVGLSLEEVVGNVPPYPWWTDDERTDRGFVPGGIIERAYRTPDGHAIPVAIGSHAVLGEDGTPALLFAMVTDLSEKRRLEQQLMQSGKLAALGELAAGVAHEINNPLFAILGLTEFLLQDSVEGTKERERLELIQHTGLEIKEIVRGLLDFARESDEERQAIVVEDVVRDTVDLVRRTNARKGVQLVDSYDGSAARIAGSPNQLKQVFLNLIGNARQAIPNGGTVHVVVRRERDHVVATVSDDGPGIPDHLLGRIFEPFFTTKRQSGGTGLGLPVSLGIVEAHGGILTVESEFGHGAMFTVRLPLVEESG
jgi:PAS domain S-box-containing protein